jgi:hypothetical protein
MSEDRDTIVRVQTPNMKRRGVLRVLRTALRDAQRELGSDRVTGVFGILVKEDNTVALLSAVTVDELRLVMKAVPAALSRVASQLVKEDAPQH